MDSGEQGRSAGEEAFERDQQTQMTTEQAIRDAVAREADIAKLDHEREKAAQKRKD